jgi:hypothetical protein
MHATPAVLTCGAPRGAGRDRCHNVNAPQWWWGVPIQIYRAVRDWLDGFMIAVGDRTRVDGTPDVGKE